MYFLKLLNSCNIHSGFFYAQRVPFYCEYFRLVKYATDNSLVWGTIILLVFVTTLSSMTILLVGITILISRINLFKSWNSPRWHNYFISRHNYFITMKSLLYYEI